VTLLLVFFALVVGGEAINLTACLALERYHVVAPSIVMAIFFVASIAVLWLSWRLAIRLTEPRLRGADRQHLLLVLSTAINAPMIA